MAVTANMLIPLVDLAQASKEATINAGFQVIDALTVRKSGETMTGGLKILRTAVATGTPNADLWVQTPADTNLTNAESVSVLIDGSLATRQFAGGGAAITNQRLLLVNFPTYSAAAAQTITNAATVHIVGSPVAGTNVTITNGAALWVQGAVVFGSNTVGTTKAGLTFAQGQNTTQPTAISVTPSASSTLTASTEAVLINFNLTRTVTWAAGALTTQREFLIQAPTYAFGGASTVTDAATLAIGGAPVAGTNATLTNSYAVWIQGGGLRAQGHLNFAGGTAPTAAAGSNAGTSPPAPVVTSGASDSRANLTFGTGTTPAAGNMVAVTFGTAFGTAPLVLVSANNAATEALNLYATAITTTGFTLGAGNAPAASQANTVYSYTFWSVQ